MFRMCSATIAMNALMVITKMHINVTRASNHASLALTLLLALLVLIRAMFIQVRIAQLVIHFLTHAVFAMMSTLAFNVIPPHILLTQVVIIILYSSMCSLFRII